MNKHLLATMGCAALLWTAPALASCSRVINVPVAQFGYGVTIKDNEVGGIFPSFLQSISEKAGCTFKWSIVPRARIEALFEMGTADMLLAAARTDRRDKAGRFVPLLTGRAALLSLNTHSHPPISNFQQLSDQKDLRLVLVRGFDYGQPYRDLIKQLTATGRASYATDPVSASRMLLDGMADAAIMPPSAVLHAAQTDARVSPLAELLKVEILDELPWLKSGIYLSKKSLAPADLDHLEKIMLAAGKSGSVYKEYAKVFPSEMLKLTIRPL